MRQIILASQSPRRKEIMAMMGIEEFLVEPSRYDEVFLADKSPEEMAVILALGKAGEVAKRYPEAIVIGSDTIVTVNDQQLAKADDYNHAYAMLEACAAAPNKVTTGLAVICLAEKFEEATFENSFVHFSPFNGQAVRDYLDTGDYTDKAGAYGVQSGAAPLIDHVKGRFDVVVGLPSRSLARILQKFGFNAKEVDYPSPVPLEPID